MDPLVKELISFYNKNNALVAIIVALIAIVLPLSESIVKFCLKTNSIIWLLSYFTVIYRLLSRKSFRDSVILVGLSDSGKTTLFSQVIQLISRFVLNHYFLS